MAFENVDVDSARNALNKCLNEISFENSKNIMMTLEKNNVWNTSAKDVLYSALNKLINTKYNDLKSQINNYLQAVSKIEQYKIEQNNLNDVLTKIEQVKIKLNSEKNKKKIYEADPDTYATELSQTKKNIIYYTNQLNNLESEKNMYYNRMDDIKSSIDSIVMS